MQCALNMRIHNTAVQSPDQDVGIGVGVGIAVLLISAIMIAVIVVITVIIKIHNRPKCPGEIIHVIIIME